MKKGFTLIELLVVITIVSILTSVILSTIAGKKTGSTVDEITTSRSLAVSNTNSKGCDGLKYDGAPDEAYDACRENCNQTTDTTVRNVCIHGNNY